jgi:ABC-type Fe3+-hydroxamate transport system substrate-binding protein
VRDDTGAEVPLAAPPRRIVSLVPSLTEAVAATGRDLLVGATDWCTHPTGLDVPRVGGTKWPRLDAVAACRPDLVLANREENRPEDVAALRAAGVPVWVTGPATVAEALDSLGRMLAACGLGDPPWLGEARRAWAEPVPAWCTAVVPIWRKPWMVLGRDTFAGDVLRLLGVANAFAGHLERYPRLALDELRAAGADLVVLPDEPYRFTADDGPGFFPGTRCALVSGRHLTWYGPSLAEARTVLADQVGRPAP